MKSKNLIIIFMIILIFLGILWLKYNSSNKEGIDEATASAMSGRILTNINNEFAAAGVDTASYVEQIPAAFDQINKLIENETKDIDAQLGITGRGPPDYSNVVDTTGSDYYPSKSFFTGSKFSDGFCKTNSNPADLNNACSTLTAENCNLTDCCVLLQGSKCVAGNALGPTNQVDEKGEDIDYAYYSYKNQCYGSCGKGLANASNPCSAYAASDKGISEGCIKRLWSQAGCPNGAYISQEFVASLKDYTKAAIQLKFKNARKDEPNYAKCYGPNESRWPVPCNETNDTSTHLSSRCLTKLFTDVGCTNTDNITAAYSTANELKSKSEMINVFTGLSTADDDSEGKLTQCYGPDEFQWPDPCLDVSETANLLNGTLPLRCAEKIFKDATKCPSGDHIVSLKSNLDSQIAGFTDQQRNTLFGNQAWMSQWTKAGIADQYSKSASQIKKNRFECYGINPNKWENMDIRTVTKDKDHCASLTPGMKYSDVSASCKARLKRPDIFPTTGCSRGNVTLVNNYVANAIGTADSSPLMFDRLSILENKYNNDISNRCKPDPPAVGSLHGWAIKNNNGSIPVVAAKYLPDGNTIVYIASDEGYTKMATNYGFSKYYYGPVDNFDSADWDTYSNGNFGYLYSPP